MKRIADLVLDFEHEGEPRMWTVLIGENGTAKTTILQAIALAAAGSRQVNTLARPVVKHLRDRRSDAPMNVDVDFAFTPQSLRDPAVHRGAAAPTSELGLWSHVWLDNGSTSIGANAAYRRNGARQLATNDVLDDARAAHTRLWFVAGYGISRNLPDSTFTPALDLPSIDRLQPLFDPRVALASSSFANHFLQKDTLDGVMPGQTSRAYAKRLNEAIQLGGDALLPEILRLELRGQGGAKSATSLIDSDRFYQRMGATELPIAGVALSHGYQSTFAWIADLIGHVLLEAKTDVSTTEMEGLVLIDEIDLYLHPAWQATFITALRRVFPKMQFIATTHSPVVLAEMAPHEIVRLIVVSAERPALLDPTVDAFLDHARWTPTNTQHARELWTWSPTHLTERGRLTIKILKLDELTDEVSSHLIRHVLRGVKDVELHVRGRRTRQAAERWASVLAMLAPEESFTAATWCALQHWMPEPQRTAWELAPIPRPE